MKRREFCKNTAISFGALGLSTFPFPALAQKDDDHFFLCMVVEGGWDPSYLFDARPLEMTKNQLIQNYLGVEPDLVTGSNGTSCWATELTKPLLAYRDRFSVLNGVHMAVRDQGHPQNMNYLMTGGTFGGASFLPLLIKHSDLAETSIDGISMGNNLFLQVNNHGKIVPLGGEEGEKLTKYLKKAEMVELNKPVFKHIHERYIANSQGVGKFSGANKELMKSISSQESLYHKISSINFKKEPGKDEIKHNVELLQNIFKTRLGRVGMVNLTPFSFDDPDNFINVDTHDFGAASTQRDIYTKIVDKIHRYVRFLSETPYDNHRSMMDVTTFMVSSEFGRTMRQVYSPFEETGTDHNPLTNTVIIGGKGIRGGQIIGESDFRSSDEKLSKAHLELDKYKANMMGKPFDHVAGKSRQDLPEAYKGEDYLDILGVINTVFTGFGIGKEHHWKASNSSPISPVIGHLLR